MWLKQREKRRHACSSLGWDWPGWFLYESSNFLASVRLPRKAFTTSTHQLCVFIPRDKNIHTLPQASSQTELHVSSTFAPRAIRLNHFSRLKTIKKGKKHTGATTEKGRGSSHILKKELWKDSHTYETTEYKVTASPNSDLIKRDKQRGGGSQSDSTL